MTVKIEIPLARSELALRLIHWIQFLKPVLESLTERELALLVEVFKLPEKFYSVPFSPIPKKLYGERMGLNPLSIQRLIASLFKKGYLVKDEYEEFDILPLMKKTLKKGLEESKIRFELDLIVKDDDRGTKRSDIQSVHTPQKERLLEVAQPTKEIGKDETQKTKTPLTNGKDNSPERGRRESVSLVPEASGGIKQKRGHPIYFDEPEQHPPVRETIKRAMDTRSPVQKAKEREAQLKQLMNQIT